MNNELILKVKKKKEFSLLPSSLVERALRLSNEDVKSARALLRKFFGVFLTNKVLKLESEEVLRSHISSKGREYSGFYEKIFSGVSPISILDIGCGVNGFSYSYLNNFLSGINYLGLEAVGQLVNKTNHFFEDKSYKNAKVVLGDIFDLDNITRLLREIESPRAILLFQVIDALESFERDSSKKLLLTIHKEIKKEDLVVISMPMKSISGRNKFEARRNWLRYFLEENFSIEEFFLGDERIFRCRKK